MQFQTSQFGVVDVDPDAVVEFPTGLPGFEHCRRFKLLHDEAGDRVVLYLQSLDDAAVAFTVTDPATVGFSYDIELDDEEQAQLQVQAAEDLRLLIILLRRIDEAHSVPLHELPVVANVTAPLVIDTRSRRGLQKILSGIRYSVHVTARG